MITIYHVPRSRSLRITWLMEELGEDYALETMPMPIPAEFREINPLGCVPTIEDPDHSDGPIRMFESLAIMQYITGRRLVAGDEKAAALTVGPRPDPAAYAEHLQFLHFGEADLTGPIGSLFRARRFGVEDNPTLSESKAFLARRIGFLDGHLSDGRTWVTGEKFTIADISIGYAFSLAELGRLDLDLPAHVAGYWRRLQERPAYQRAVAK